MKHAALLATKLSFSLALVAISLLLLASVAEADELPYGSCEDPLVIVDKEHSLPPLYAASDLVFIGDYSVPLVGWNGLLREEAAEHLAELVSAAGSDGQELAVASAYRSFYEQSLVYSFYANLYGSEAGRVSAMPGHSEHQLGTTVDFTNADVGYDILQDFGDTEAAGWLQENAAEYGFVSSYPKGEEEKTGYIWEPWHYRYVGVKAARKIQDKDIDARDFLLEKGVKPDC